MTEEDKTIEEELELPALDIFPLEKRIVEIVKKHQNRHAPTSKEMVINELRCWCLSKNLPPFSGEEYAQAIYNLTHGYTPGLHCTEIVHREGDREITEYFSWEN